MKKTAAIHTIKTEKIFGISITVKVQAGLLLALGFLAYIPMLSNGFTYFSDDNYVLNNAIIQHLSWHNIKYIFSAYFDGHYHPFTMLSLGMTWALAGSNPILYQWTNLLLHLANVVLVLWLVRLLFRNPEMAFLVALLFGIHTIHVESVARITERKDMLYTLFYLLSAVAYVKYLDRKKPLFYIYSLFLFTCSLLSKGQAVSLFFTVVLIDYLRERKLLSFKVILEKLPFFVLALFFGYLNLMAQRYTGYFLDYKAMAFYEPVVDASFVLTNYLARMILPVNLSALYPYPNLTGAAVPAWMWLYLLTFIVIIFLIIYFYKRNRIIFFGMMFYLFNIILMLRIIPVAENISPDRYNYVPSIGFFIILYCIYQYVKNNKPKSQRPTNYALSAYLLLLFILTLLRTPVWKSGETVWSDAYKKYPKNTYILQNMANLRISQGKFKEGYALVEKALEADPENVLALISRIKGNSAQKNQEAEEKDLDYIRQLEPKLAENIANKGNALFLYGNMKKDGEIIEKYYREAIDKYPYNAKFYFNLGVYLYATKRYDEAIDNFNKGIAFKPYNIDYYYLYLGTSKQLKGDQMAGAADFRTALKYNPDNKEVKKMLQGKPPA